MMSYERMPLRVFIYTIWNYFFQADVGVISQADTVFVFQVTVLSYSLGIIRKGMVYDAHFDKGRANSKAHGE